MLSSLLLTAFLMGLAGGPHCLAMCGAACAGMAGVSSRPVLSTLSLFQAGRLLGYATLGALAAGALQTIGWLSVQSAAFRPLWSLFHAAAFLLGVVLIWRAEQPAWLTAWAAQIWRRVLPAARREQLQRSPWGPFALGCVWALLPCGLLYSAVMVAALAGQAPGGAAVMAAFAVGSGLVLTLGPWLWLRLNATSGPMRERVGVWGVRLAGLSLCGFSAWALWLGLVHNQAPWCVTP